jgi:predicted AAA+ superfamily ATPase
MFSRELTKTIKKYTRFPVVALLGPRQSGKTTLVQSIFPKHKFLSLDREVTQLFAMEDPEGFLLTHENKHGVILDEFQYVPKLTTYIKLEADKKNRPGYFILTGSQNFLAHKAITESLAGRVGILNLFSLSNKELLDNKLTSGSIHELIFYGGYPRIYAEKILPTEFYPSYILSYIQRDVGQLINPKNISIFYRFVQLCAGRIGQLCNVNALASEAGISSPTAKEWLSILQASYILFFLEPHFKNFNKRLIKMPKLYFFDTGLACSLLRIGSPEALSVSHFNGALFESLIISDLYKQNCNLGLRPALYFWRDAGGAHEVDCILDHGIKNYPVEIKAGKSIASDSFNGLDYWNKLSNANSQNSYLVYSGDEKQIRKQGNVIGWKDSSFLIKNIISKKKSHQKRK